jgi:hypothetical protein
MPLSVPPCLTTSFSVHDGADIALLGECFAPEATVLDEGQQYQGHAAIQTWLREALEKFACTTVPLEMTKGEEKVMVRTRVSGNVPGSPVELDHHFTIAEGKIQALAIH